MKKNFFFLTILLGVVISMILSSSYAPAKSTTEKKPTVVSITPKNGAQGETIDVTIKGKNFVGTPTVSLGAGITANSVTFVSDKELTANITIASDAKKGPRSVVVTNADGKKSQPKKIFSVTKSTGPGKLTLNLETSLDQEPDGDIVATSITKAELLSKDGSVVKTATISGGTAQFDLSGMVGGDYFIRVNDLNDNLVPTRINAASKDVNQFVEQKLGFSVIGSLTDPTYRIKTFSKAQGGPAVIKYSTADGTDTAPIVTPEEYAYFVVSPKATPQKIEIHVLGTAVLLNSFASATGKHLSPYDYSYVEWQGAAGENHHGDIYGGDDTKCSGCHGNLDTHVAKHSDIETSNGWCFRCHNGKGGDGMGFIDPSK